MLRSLSLRRQHTPSGAQEKLCARLALALFLGSLFVIGAPLLSAQSDSSSQNSQDVAESARQERARKQEPGGEHHVYTNEDLRRRKILTPEDQSRATTAKQKQQPRLMPKPDAQPLDANSGRPQEPLGDVARRYRNLRREAIHPSPFHLPANQPELAAPKMIAPVPPLKPNAQPRPPARTFVLANPSAPMHRSPNFDAPAMPSAPMRRVDPFSRRRQPIPPAVAIRPIEPRGNAQLNPAAPSFRMDAPPSRSADLRPALVAPSGAVVVKPGDTLWALSRQYLGRGTRWLELMVANPNLPDPGRLAPGTVLSLPARSASRRSGQGANTVVVQAGDTLTKLALDTYGRASYWSCIAAANPVLSNPDRLAVGQVLALPASCQP
ncbi:MAG: LysM peptidoglycan-binding domain-containing protein [Acidobacteria bacterium]|nr:LysM peptidoglycan-binding domain-containing protein [Acidobacteriota bacterium]MBS1866179.1 LysM peptidoglycan-binding domain-containing protein [Acidobacteriota bacterium]